MRSPVGRLVPLLLSTLLGACAAGDGGGWNVLLLTLDTTRADHFGFAGHEAARTPNFDAFAAYRAVRFADAISAVPVTFPSHTTIMTGTWPVFHGVHDNDGYFLDDGATTLAEILRDEGFRTGAVVASYPLDSQVNLDQGFETYDDDYQADWSQGEIQARTALSFGFLERRADQVNRAVERWLEDTGDERFFLWAHYFDPHQPYSAPPPYDSLFADSPYDAEMAFMDEAFGELLALLEARDLLDRTLVVVVGDHGESLGQHGEPTHANYVYDATMQVPLLVAAPGDRFTAGAEVAAQVRTLDLAPTVLDLLGLPAGDEMQGRSLVPLLEEPDAAWQGDALIESHYPRFHYGWAPLRALRDGEWKLILAPRRELYRVSEDPAEVHNLVRQEGERAAAMEERLHRSFRRFASDDPGRSAAAQVDDETREKLMALGYLSGSTTTAERSAPFPTPEELAAMTNPMDRALVLDYANFSMEMIRQGRVEEAIPMIRNGLAIDPENYRLHVNLARAYALTGLLDRAVERLELASELRPGASEPYQVLGRVHVARRDWEAAIVALEEAVRLSPQEVSAIRTLAASLALAGRDEEAIGHFEAVLALDENNWEARVDLADAYARQERWEEARAMYQSALDRHPYSAAVRYRIAVFYRRVGDPEFSRTMLEGVLQVAPEHAAAHLELADLMLAEGATLEQVRPHLEAAARAGGGSTVGRRAAELLGEPGAGGGAR